MRSQAIVEQENSAQQTARWLSHVVSERHELLQTAVRPDVLTDSLRIDTYFRFILNTHAEFHEIVLLNNNGVIINSAVRDTPSYFFSEQHYDSVEWYLKAQSGENFEALIDIAENEQVLVFSQPIRQGRAYEGYILAALLESDFLSDGLASTNDSETVYFLVQQDGTVLAASSEEPPPDRIETGYPASKGQFTSYHGEKVLNAAASIPQTPWIVLSQRDSTGILADINRRVAFMLMILLIVMGVASWGVWRLADLWGKPLRQLARRVRDTNPDLQFNEPDSEVSILTLAFISISEKMQRQEYELRTSNTILRARTGELTALSRQTIAIAEEERRRIAHDLHDSFGQMLVALKMTLDFARQGKSRERVKQLLDEASTVTEQIIDETHRISEGLRPTVLDDLGLKEALEWYIRQIQSRFDISIEYQLDSLQTLRLNPEGEITAFRFVQEALTNIHKHANASFVSLRFRQQANFMMLVVKDNGKGFDPRAIKQANADRDRISLGLTGLQERLVLAGGELVIHSQPDKGTTLIALLPLLSAS